jgi:hypothetical protein
MFNTDELKAMLQNGQKAEDIANNFAETLNAAIAADEEERKADLKKATDSARKEQAALVVDTLFEFLDEWYPELGTHDIEVDPDNFIAVVDEIAPQVERLVKVYKALLSLDDSTTTTTKKIKVLSDPIEDFLKTFNLL